MENPKPSAFAAYSSRDRELARTLLSGIRKANAVDANPVRYEPWEFNDISGKNLITPIITKIEESPFVVADITYLNANVVYEIGYAMGVKRKVLLLKNSEIEGDASLAKTVGVFDTIGYSTYTDDEDVKHKLTSHISEDAFPFEISLNAKAPVYVLPSVEKPEAASNLISRIKKARYGFRSFTPSEDIRLSAADAIGQVACSAGVVVMLDSSETAQGLRALFVCGLADGMGKPLLMISADAGNAPLDIRDSVKSYRHPGDIADHVADFCPEINAALGEDISVSEIDNNMLGRLSVGDPTAENEMTTLSRYYLKTDEFKRALRGEINLVVGRKGSGKTALFIQLRNQVRSDKRNIVVDLKPESYQLLKLKDEILQHLAEGSKQHLITAFWEYLILLEVARKLLEKDHKTHRFDHTIRELYEHMEARYRGIEGVSEGDFSERIIDLSQRLTAKYDNRFKSRTGEKLTSDDVTELLYSHDLKSLRQSVSDYLEHKGRVLVLFDNIDKGWATGGVDDVDAVTLRCLIDAGRKVERDMQNRGHQFRCILFVRNDVYQHLMENSPDYGKEMRATLDWGDPNLLREMLRLRLVSGLGDEFSEKEFSKIWSQLAEAHVFGEESSAFIIDRSLMRPRNVIKLFNHTRAFAANFGKKRMNEDDFYRGAAAYSQDLLIELDRELSDVYPFTRDLLYHFVGCSSVIGSDGLAKIFDDAEIPTEYREAVSEFLLYHGVLGLKNENDEQFIFDLGYDMRQVKVRVKRLGEDVKYVINPAFAPALDIKDLLFERQPQFGI